MNEWLRDTPLRFAALAMLGAVGIWVMGEQTRWIPWGARTADQLDYAWGTFAARAVTLLVALAPVVALRRPWVAAAMALVPFVLYGVLSWDSEWPLLWVFQGYGHTAALTIVVSLVLTAMVTWWRSRATGAVIGLLALAPVVGYAAGGLTLLLPFETTIYAYDQSLVDASFEVGAYALVVALCLGAAELMRRSVVKDRRRATLEARAAEVERESAVNNERARLTRDLHDVVAHHVSLIAVRAETAPYVVEDLSPSARRVLEEIAEDSRGALDELRGVLGVLRRSDDAPALAPLPGANEIGTLIAQAREVGATVEWAPVDLGSVSTSAGHVGFRVVQEALTNARRHSPSAPVVVETVPVAGGITISVTNPLPADASSELTEGRGLAGMRERVEAMGGTLRIIVDDGRLVVRAEIPAEGR